MTTFLRKALAALMFMSMVLAPIADADTSGNVALRLQVDETTATDLGASTWKLQTEWPKVFSNGVGTNQASKVFQDTVTLAGSGAQSYDLDSTLTGPLGSVTFSRIFAIAVRRTNAPAATTQDENVTIGGDFVLTKYLLPGGDTLANTTIPIHPGGVFFFVAPNSTGVAVTATTGDVVTLTNASSADSCTLEVVILGS